MLSCYCNDDYDHDDHNWWYWYPTNYKPMRWFPRRKRCTSCEKIINHRELVVEIPRTRGARDDIEAMIYGDGPEAITIASGYMCEYCADIYFSLDELGFCVNPYENMVELLDEYHEMVNAK